MIQKRIEVDGGWLTADVFGAPDGPALVMVPGVMADAAAWAGVAAHLSEWQTVVVVNRRGRRPSGPLTPTYSLQNEIDDVMAVVDDFSDVRTIFGWSYGGLIALHLANARSVRHVIAYEPIMRPFGSSALSDLRRAHDAHDGDAAVEIALGQVSGMDDESIESLRAQDAIWSELRRLSEPIFAETEAINTAPQPVILASEAEQVDLIVGERNRGLAPYGTTFEDVARLVRRGTVHELTGQAHLAHLEAPGQLAAFVDKLAHVAN